MFSRLIKSKTIKKLKIKVFFLQDSTRSFIEVLWNIFQKIIDNLNSIPKRKNTMYIFTRFKDLGWTVVDCSGGEGNSCRSDSLNWALGCEWICRSKVDRWWPAESLFHARSRANQTLTYESCPPLGILVVWLLLYYMILLHCPGVSWIMSLSRDQKLTLKNYPWKEDDPLALSEDVLGWI